MNQLILAYVRITCYAAMYCMSMLIGTSLGGESKKEARRYFDNLMDIRKMLDNEADKLNEE